MAGHVFGTAARIADAATDNVVARVHGREEDKGGNLKETDLQGVGGSDLHGKGDVAVHGEGDGILEICRKTCQLMEKLMEKLKEGADEVLGKVATYEMYLQEIR